MDTHTGLLWAILAADNGGGGRREAGRKSSDYSSESELSGDLRPSGFPRTDVSIGSCDAVKPREIHEAVVSGATIESDTGIARIHPGYRETARVFEGLGLGEGIRSKVGVRHVPLAELFNKLLAADLRLESVAELDGDTLPSLLAVVATKA